MQNFFVMSESHPDFLIAKISDSGHLEKKDKTTMRPGICVRKSSVINVFLDLCNSLRRLKPSLIMINKIELENPVEKIGVDKNTFTILRS